MFGTRGYSIDDPFSVKAPDRYINTFTDFFKENEIIKMLLEIKINNTGNITFMDKIEQIVFQNRI